MDRSVQTSFFRCPVCGGALQRGPGSLECAKGHGFDVAKEGYVNLLMSQRAGEKVRGDDALMVGARRDFLERGYYRPLLELIGDVVAERPAETLLDAGCGEGYYTGGLKRRLASLRVAGADISRRAVRTAAKREAAVEWAVASCYRLPVADSSVDVLINLFAPTAGEEFSRLLADKGRLIRVRPLPMHLWELKQAVYGERAEPNPLETGTPEGFSETGRHPLELMSPLMSGQELGWLFQMTPYFYTSSPQERERAMTLSAMRVRLAFDVAVCEKSESF